MLLNFFGEIVLLIGFAVLLLPLFVTELSRPRDSLWGAVVLVSGLGLITTNDHLSGSSMVAAISGSLLISRLGCEVAQSRWQQLSSSEKLRLGSMERWVTGLKQFGAVFAQWGAMFSGPIKIFDTKPSTKTKKKKWIRPENNLQSEPPGQAATASQEKLGSSKDDLQQQPQETLERHRPLKDS